MRPFPRPALWLASIAALLLFGWVCLMRVEALGDTAFSAFTVNDFANDWAAAKLYHANKPHVLYDTDAYNIYLQSLWDRKVEWHSWSYPPHLLPLLGLFTYYSYPMAMLLWSLLGLLAYIVTLRLAPAPLPSAWRTVLMASPAVLINLVNGQTGLFCTLFLLGGFYLMPKRPWLAGIMFGLLTVKPQLGLLLIPLLLVMQEWRVIAAALATTLALVALSIWLMGTTPWMDFWTLTRMTQLALLEQFTGFFTYMMPGMFAGLRLLGFSATVAYIGHAMVAIPVAIMAVRMVRKEGITPRSTLAFTLATILVTPYAFNYDMAMVSLALGVYLYTTPPAPVRERSIWLVIWAMPMAMYPLHLFHFPLAPLFLVAGFLMLWREHRQAYVPISPR